MIDKKLVIWILVVVCFSVIVGVSIGQDIIIPPEDRENIYGVRIEPTNTNGCSFVIMNSGEADHLIINEEKINIKAGVKVKINNSTNINKIYVKNNYTKQKLSNSLSSYILENCYN